jgi:SM-20-related protein
MLQCHSQCRFDLDPELDVAELGAEFAKRKRILISRVLSFDGAVTLSRLLAKEHDWLLSISANANGRQFVRRKSLSNLKMRDAFEFAYSDGGRKGSHLYETISVEQGGTTAAAQCYRAFARFINSESFLTFVRALTGIQAIRGATAFACRYCPGEFYSFHSDATGGAGHRVSYVLNLTRRWEPQWGGLLQFRDTSGCVESAYVPRFNSMSVFCAEQEHAVSMVAPFAMLPRLSISGALII